MDTQYEIQINYVGIEWHSIRDENNNHIYLYETEDIAFRQLEKLQNQYPECRLKIIEVWKYYMKIIALMLLRKQ